MNKRVGLFGGTFDPVHNGHLSIAQSFLQSSFINELWILLTPFPPHKREKNHVSYLKRKEMLELVFAKKKHVKILTIENDLPKPSYSFNTISYLKKLHPDLTFLFCIGEDNLSKFHSWKHHEKILKEVELLVAKRPGADHSDVESYILRKTTFVDHVPVSISSSKVKKVINNRLLLKELIPENVIDFIQKEALYRHNE